MIVIPMAGKSSRFFNAGYKIPKYKLPIFNNSDVFTQAVRSFENYFKTDLFVFLHRNDDDSAEFILNKCKSLGIDKFTLFKIKTDTRGQADTIAIFLKTLNKSLLNEPLYIFNIDSFRKNFLKPELSFFSNMSGYLELFRGLGNHWSFAKTNGVNVQETAEKVRISDYCSNGLYFFKTAEIFINTFSKLEKMHDGELYIAPMYNYLIADGKKIKFKIIGINQTIFCGTPVEYEQLLNTNKK